MEQPFPHFVFVGRPKLWCNAYFSRARATVSLFRAGQTSDMQILNVHAFIILCSSDVRNCGDIQVFHLGSKPFHRVVLVGRPKLW